MDEIKLKNVANPIELLATLKSLASDIEENNEAVETVEMVHQTLEGTEYLKEFTDIDDCLLLNGNSDLTEGYLYC